MLYQVLTLLMHFWVSTVIVSLFWVSTAYCKKNEDLAELHKRLMVFFIQCICFIAFSLVLQTCALWTMVVAVITVPWRRVRAFSARVRWEWNWALITRRVRSRAFVPNTWSAASGVNRTSSTSSVPATMAGPLNLTWRAAGALVRTNREYSWQTQWTQINHNKKY